MILDSPQARGGGTTFDSPITSAKSGVNVNVTDSQDQRSTNTDGDPTMLNGIPRAGNSAVDVIPTMSATVRGIAKLGFGLEITSDTLRTKQFESDVAEASERSTSNGGNKWATLQIDGDPNYYYPVVIRGYGYNPGPNEQIIVYRSLGETCNSTYQGNHSNGTSSLSFIIEGRINGWDGNANRHRLVHLIENYASLVGKWECQGGVFNGTVIWLRGGGTKYHIYKSRGWEVCQVYYSTIQLGNSNYPYSVGPIAYDDRLNMSEMMRKSASYNTYYSKLYCAEVECSGNINAAKVYNAVWNDYAELFERGCDTEPGDLIALDTTSSDEKYVLANETKFNKVVGVHSDEYGHLIGGENPKDGTDFLQYNLPKFIPVGLCGRVKTKVTGTCKKGDYLVASSIDGVARKYKSGVDDPLLVFGMACEDKNADDIDRIRVYLK